MSRRGLHYLPGDAVSRYERGEYAKDAVKDVPLVRRRQKPKPAPRRMYRVASWDYRLHALSTPYRQCGPEVMCERCLNALRDNKHVYGLTHTEIPREQWPESCSGCRVRCR